MKQVQAGDTAQLAVLFERHHLGLYRYLLYQTGNAAASEDLVQEVFFRVLKFAHSYNPHQPFAVWLYQLARNLHYDALRKGRAEVSDGEITETRSNDPMPEELMTRKQDALHLRQALNQLPRDKREVRLLSRFQDEVFCELRGQRAV